MSGRDTVLLRPRDAATVALAVITILAVLTSLVLLAGAGFFRPGGRFPPSLELSHIGGFLGGVFAPIVLAWAARSFFLQRQQLAASMAAMAQQAELQRAANEQQSAQLQALERHREEDLRLEAERTAPRFSLRSVTNYWSQEKNCRVHETEITNVGALAVGYRLRIHSILLAGKEPLLVHNEDSALPFRPDESRTVHVYLRENLPSQVVREGFFCELEIMRADQRVTFQRFRCDQSLAHFDLEQFEAVARERQLRLPAFGSSKR